MRFTTSNGKVHTITREQWLNSILKPVLVETIPIEIFKLFEVARGALAYGYFFYPLYTLACEQLFRVSEAAVMYKCKAMQAPCSINTFEKGLEYLISKKVIPDYKKNIWDAIRKLRNKTSHPRRQTILVPGQVIGILERIADEINTLFCNI